MERRGMGMSADWVVAIGIFACVEQHPYHLDFSVVRGNGQGEVPLVVARCRAKSAEILDAPERRGDREGDASAALDQMTHCFNLAKHGCHRDGAIGISSAIAKNID